MAAQNWGGIGLMTHRRNQAAVAGALTEKHKALTWKKCHVMIGL